VPPPDDLLKIFPKDHRFRLRDRDSGQEIQPERIFPYLLDRAPWDWRPCMWTVRYLLPNGEKTVRPWIWARQEGEDDDDARLRMKGLPRDFARPLYNLYRLEKTFAEAGAAPVLIVEGEKCAESVYLQDGSGGFPRYAFISDRFFGGIGFVSVTWSGGCASVAKTDWSPLARAGQIVIWPDADDGGMKAAQLIAGTLMELRPGGPPPFVMDFSGKGKPKGWDIADWFGELERGSAGMEGGSQ
jgi:hypothetical protein